MEEKKKFLIGLMKKYYSQGDSYFADLSKRGNWHFGYTNDYEMQHGSGEQFHLPERMIDILMSNKQ